jgi:hypothetical protein
MLCLGLSLNAVLFNIDCFLTMKSCGSYECILTKCHPRSLKLRNLSMSQSQVKIRLDARTIEQIKQQSSELQISFSALCNRLLENEVFGADSKSVGIARVCVKLDRLLSTLRSIDKKISISKENHAPNPNQN